MNAYTLNIKPFETDFEFGNTLESFDEFAEEEQEIFPEYGEAGKGLFDPSADLLQDKSAFRDRETAELEYGSALDVLSSSELKAVRITSTFETGRAGGFGGLTGNFDGQGLSFGLLNFTIKAGSLIPLLQEFISKHPTRYSSSFEKDADRFKEVVFATRPDPKNPKRRIRDVERQMAFVNNQMNSIPKKAKGNRIIEPWKTYFGRLEKDKEFQKIQVKAVRGALDRARYWYEYFDFKTERGFAFMFDLVSSHGGAWLNAKKFKGKRRALLQRMLAAKKAAVGRDTLTELEKMEVIANMIADVSLEEWREKVRVRKLWFVRGSGKVHGHLFDIKKNFGITDSAPDLGPRLRPTVGASELAWERNYGNDDEQEFERGGPLSDSRIIDLTAQADKRRRIRTRDPKKVYTLVLHQMACCFKVRDPLKRFLKIAPHFAILPDGRILQLHPILSLTGASNGFNSGSVAVEFAGNFPNIRGKWWIDKKELGVLREKLKKLPEAKIQARIQAYIKANQNQVTPEQIEAGRYLVRYLIRTMGLRVIVAHRQSSGTRENDPGPDIWHQVGQWAIDNLGLSDGGPNYKIGTGNAIPDIWRKWGQAKPQQELFSDYESEEWEATPEFELLPEIAAVRSSRAGEQYVDTSTWNADPLRAHGGTGANVLLRWNDMPSDTRSIDVVVHLHGYIGLPSNAKMLREVAARSGLDLSGRTQPTLAILPRGRRIRPEEVRQNQARLNEIARRLGKKPATARSDVYTFPALWRDGGAGLASLITGALQWFAQQRGGGAALPIARLIFTAHSGGGAALDRLVALHARRKVCNPDEVHAFDALYSEASGLKSWATARLRADRGRTSDQMATLGGGLRILYGAGTRPQSCAVDGMLPGPGDPLRPWYRAERTTVKHVDIPKKFGGALLRDRTADLGLRSECPARPKGPRAARASFESEDEEAETQIIEIAPPADIKAPLPVPPGDPIPFAPPPPRGSYWPVRTRHKYGRVVSYQPVGATIGRKSRMFLANRQAKRDNKIVPRWHVGVDLFANVGDVVVACEKGTIVGFAFFYKSKSGQRTYQLLIEHSGVVVNYGEVTGDSLDKHGLRVGMSVRAGQLIGFVSDTSMLHFETYVKGTMQSRRWFKDARKPPQLLNPTKYLLFLRAHGLVAGAAGQRPVASSGVANTRNELQSSHLAWPGEMEFETARPKKRTGPGTDCGRSGAPAALVSQPGGRCIGPTPPVCPSVTGILSLQRIGNIPFEYVDGVRSDPSTNLVVVTRRLRPRTQRFLPSVQTALTQFVANMNRFGIPIEAILTAGSYCCRCISRTNSLSNHSSGHAFDLVGVRWASSGGRETIVHNWNSSERPLLRRINACLRLSFATVLDYYVKGHQDHFHCDTPGRARNPRGQATLKFTQEALSVVLGRNVPRSGKFDAATQTALIEFAGATRETLRNSVRLNEILDRLFTRIAAAPSSVAQPAAAAGLTREVSARLPWTRS